MVKGAQIDRANAASAVAAASAPSPEADV